jgi:hypothetical protein
MSVDTTESSVTHIGRDKAMATVNDAVRPERRKRTRVTLHWPILFFRDHSDEATEIISTQNLSSDGFYCLSRIAFAPGEAVTCRLEVPSHEPSNTGHARLLECKVRVMRAEPASGYGLFGVACRIEDYRFVLPGPDGNLPEPLGPIPLALDREHSSQ